MEANDSTVDSSAFDNGFQDDISINADIRSLMNECIEKIRRLDPPDSWEPIHERIAELQKRLDRRGCEVPCTYCGADRPTTSLRVYELRRAAVEWHLCYRCWQFLEIGFVTHRPERDIASYLAAPAPPPDVAVRTYI